MFIGIVVCFLVIGLGGGVGVFVGLSDVVYGIVGGFVV